MLAPAPSAFRWWFTNQGTPNINPGTAVTPGTSNAEGSATVLATGSEIAEDVYGVLLVISGGATAAQSKMHLLDLGFDPAGGTTYDWIVQELGVGSSFPTFYGGKVIWLPIFIPAGSQVACRIQGSNATAGTVGVWATFFGRPTRPEAVWAASYSENVGTISGSAGVAVTPGVSSAEGSWTSIGTASRRLRYIVPCLQMDDASTNAQAIWMDVAINQGGTRQIIAEHIPFMLTGTSEQIGAAIPPNGGFFCDVPAGAALEARLSISITPADNAYNINLVGLG